MKAYSQEECIKIQNQLADKICKENMLSKENIKTMAGVDLAYWKEGEKELTVCCIIVIDAVTLEVLEEAQVMGEIYVPYIPGCLAFRELPFILETVKKLKTHPDLYVFDGNGYLHPRHMGIATHAAIYLKKPSIGVAKSYYRIEETDFVIPENKKGAFSDIVIHGEIYGRALRTHKDVKPIFVSIGNYIDLDTATDIICVCITKESHIPVPTRLADLATHTWRSFYQEERIKERKII